MMKGRLLLFTAIIFAVSAVTSISLAQRTRDNGDKPIAGDFKITVKTTVQGQSREGTTLIKGQRERDETVMAVGGMNISQTSITQCDLKRTIQINDSSRKYMITPMESGDSGNGGSRGGSTPATGGAARSGGVVTMTINTIDTGERKEMFGFTARHFKRTTLMESSPDACSQTRMKFETDGWYINLEYGLNCNGGASSPYQGGAAAAQGCRDRYQSKYTGPTNLGFALMETMTMFGDDGRAMFSSTKEVVGLSRQPLDAALFDVPSGYTQASNQQELAGTPSMADIMSQTQQQAGDNHGTANQSSTANSSSNSSAASRARVGVVEFNNKTKSTVSTDSLRDQLIAMLKGNGIDAVALNASSPSEAAIEAKAKECTFVLYTDVSTLKAASSGKKIGGMLGRAAGVSSGEAGKSEARLDFRLIATGSSSPTVQSSASSKEDSDQASISAAIENEAKAVASAVGKT
jgi:hypothetical protein